MNAQLLPPPPRARKVHYPDSDGKRMSDNTKQFRYIVTIVSGFQALYRDRNDVFVGGDLLWYPVEGDNKTRIAPDALVALGRPPGDRGSYKQWEEANHPLDVVFEVLSPSNTRREMANKLAFYDRFGVSEYYVYDPDRGALEGWIRRQGRLTPVPNMQGWRSPLTGVSFALQGLELILTHPDGKVFESYVELTRRADAERARAERMAARLRALGLDPEA